MSHQPERKEKDCLNCGTEVLGRFCHVCGQENVITHQKFWALAKHFVFDILHFDGKFFHTLLYMFTRPGFVARQYVAGKRMSYLDPIRMYLFTSAMFFLIFFSFNTVNLKNGQKTAVTTTEGRLELARSYQQKQKKNPGDSVLRNAIVLLKDTSRLVNVDSLEQLDKDVFNFGDRDYVSLLDYDAVQLALPLSEKDGWLKRRLIRQTIRVNEKYGKDEVVKVYLETFIHKLPYLLFFSLPFFALTLKLLYHRRKNFFYSDHAVFTLYHYVFSFILLLLVFGLAALQEWTGWRLFSWLLTGLFLFWHVYLFAEMKNFYGQGRVKTLGKFLLLNFAGLIILLLLFVFFLLFSIFQL